MLLHASVVELEHHALLLRGPSGCGKSDLALRLIDAGALLVADDQVQVEAQDGVLWARPPPALAGLIEIRGVGVCRLPHLQRSPLALAVDLVPPERVERLPEAASATVAGVRLPRLALAPFEPAAVAKLRLVMHRLSGRDSLG